MPINLTPIHTRGQVLSNIQAVDTTDAAPYNVFSFPVATNQHIGVNVEFMVRKMDYTKSTLGLVQCGFIRDGGGVMRQGTPMGDSATGFVGQKPTVDLVADIPTQSIKVLITGLANTNLVWFVQTIVTIYT